MEISWLAVEKSRRRHAAIARCRIHGYPRCLVAPSPRRRLTRAPPLLFAVVAVLVALFSATGGLALGCSMQQTHIGLMFSLVVAPMIFFGCTYYPGAR